jgi:hypothetical protein
MESVVSLIFSVENIRMLVMLAFGFCGYVLIKSQMRGLEYSLGKRVDCVEKSLLNAMDEKISNFHSQLKATDFRHLNDTIEALAFTLEKNKYLSVEDRNYISGRLEK